jgi:hypothetical protein
MVREADRAGLAGWAGRELYAWILMVKSAGKAINAVPAGVAAEGARR